MGCNTVWVIICHLFHGFLFLLCPDRQTRGQSFYCEESGDFPSGNSVLQPSASVNASRLAYVFCVCPIHRTLINLSVINVIDD